VKHPRTSHTSVLTRVNTSHRVSPHLQPSLISPSAGSVGAVAHEHGALSRGATCAKGQMADDRTQGHTREQQRMHAWLSVHATERAQGAGRGCSLARGGGVWALVERVCPLAKSRSRVQRPVDARAAHAAPTAASRRAAPRRMQRAKNRWDPTSAAGAMSPNVERPRPFLVLERARNTQKSIHAL
jgi:hypothetical protein